MLNIKPFIDEVANALIRAITGRIFTEDQIKKITSDAIGKYFADLFPTPKEELVAKERFESARNHILSASTIIREMQQELEGQDKKLTNILQEIEEKKKLADHYQALAKTNQKEFQAFREEMEVALRKELIQQTERGKRLRQILSILIWLFTLIAGAALGTYFNQILTWIRTLFA